MTDRTEAEATGLPMITEDQLERLKDIRRAGTAAVMEAKEVQRIKKQIQGIQFGSVQGSSLSPQTQAAMAEFCHVTGANPLTHIDVLGGRPFLNSTFWSDKLNRHPAFVRLEQRELNEETEQALRDRGAEYKSLAEELPEGSEDRTEYLRRSVELREEADDVALARAKWGVPEYVESAVETTIFRFVNAAPLDAIQNGEIPWDEAQKWVKTVVECNWAGGRHTQQTDSTFRKDPIGDAFPAKTARTRSLRRTAAVAFSAWGEEHAERVERAEEILRAEWEIIQEDDEAIAAEVVGEGVRVGGSREPEAAAAEGAKEIPTRTGTGEEDEEGDTERPPEDLSTEERIRRVRAQDPDGFDVDDWRKRLFATLREAGIDGDQRKAWAEENDLPRSTKLWTHEDYKRAVRILVAPVREKYKLGCTTLGIDPAEFARETVGEPHPNGYTLGQYKELLAAINAEADRAADEEESGGSRGTSMDPEQDQPSAGRSGDGEPELAFE